MPPVTDAFEVIEIANKMLKRAGYGIYHIAEVRLIDTRFWQVEAIAYLYILFQLDSTQNEGVNLLSIDLQYFSMSSEKTNIFNGVNTQTLSTVFSSMQNQPEMAKVTFSVKSQWNGGFSVETTASKRFRVGGQNIERNTEHKAQYDFPAQISGEDRGPTVCEGCMGALAACLTQTIVAHATSRGIQLDGINIDVEGDVDMRGFAGISSNVRPGAQQFRVNVNIQSSSASKEQLDELREIGKRHSPAYDTLTKGTSVVVV